MGKTLIIEIPYAGLGDHLFHSHLPRIAKETGQYEKVFISHRSPVRHNDYKNLVWDLNPHLDGFVDEPGVKCVLDDLRANIRHDTNLLDVVMSFFGLDDGLKMHEPEIYYKPQFVSEYNKIIFDPNHISYIGEIDKKDVMWYFKKNKIKFEAIMNIRNELALYIPKQSDLIINTPTLLEFCDLIHSSSQLYCLTSGTATLAAALGKSATVYYGEYQEIAFQHSKLHEYIRIEKCPQNKFMDLMKRPFQLLKKAIIPKRVE